MMQKIKLLMLGPSESGKTIMSNFLSECVDMEANNETRPTQGARILEFEVNNLNTKENISKVDVELWDCSGDHRYETCWPIFRNNIHGVVFVCSVNNASVATRDFDLLYNYFVGQPELSPKQCIVFYNTLGLQNDSKGLRLSQTFSTVSQVPVNITEAGNKFKSDFTNYLSTVVNIITDHNK